MNAPVPRFAADAMLGRLARWLRVLGLDTFYEAGIADAALVRIASEEARILLTRDRHLLRELRPVQAVEIRIDDPLQQLQHVVQELQLPGPGRLFSRCLLDNTLLSEPLAAAAAARALPHAGFDLPTEVRRCPRCDRLYWEGSHARRMRDALERVLPGWGRPAP